MDTKNVEIYEKLAKKYDLATTIVSFGIEKIWRKIFVKKIKKYIKNGILLDVASATGDMAKEMNFDKMYLLDPSKQMNKIAKEKLKDKNVVFIEDFAETFTCLEKVDLITAFMAVRNFDNLEKGIKNLDKCLKVGGYFAILELTKSDSLFFKLSMFYMSRIVPLIGGIITKEFDAYKKFPKMIKNISDEDILKNFKNYEILEKKRLFPPMATLIIMRKNG
jgi:demethylmenaquinone methyltransferase/2-methoxy-6-polyprenyl-1,4-benzoquinol methylase